MSCSPPYAAWQQGKELLKQLLKTHDMKITLHSASTSPRFTIILPAPLGRSIGAPLPHSRVTALVLPLPG